MEDMIFLSAQPDTPYFHWQIEIYMYQFSKYNILDRCYALMGYTDKPSSAALRLQSKYNIVMYEDTRKDKSYVPSIASHLYKKFLRDNKQFKYIFFHDSDIFLVKMPDFESMLDNMKDSNKSFVSNTINYIGFEYIKDCSLRYRSKYPDLPELDILIKMCDVVDIDPLEVLNRESESGGAQYLLQNTDFEFWDRVEDISNKLYAMFLEYDKLYPIDNPIQKWTAGMWSCLWLYWMEGYETIVSPELDFSWATGTVDDYDKKNIFHLAGVTCSMKNVFYKGDYSNKSVFEAYNKDRSIFDKICPTSSTKRYTDIIKQYFNEVYALEHSYLTDHQLASRIKYRIKSHIKQFRIICDTNNSKHRFDGMYVISDVWCCNRPVFISTDKKYIIFFNTKAWISTSYSNIKSIGSKVLGIASNLSEWPYLNNWNIDCVIDSLCD